MRRTSKSLKVLANSLAFSAAIVFSTGILAGAEWKIETVDTSGSGRFASMKIDANGNVHVAYIPEEDRHPLKYAYWDHALDKWFTMTVANNASFCTLVLDSKQRPHISYADFGSGKGTRLRYVHWEGGAEWKSELVSPRTDAAVAYYTSIALDSKDIPSFSYYDYEGAGGVGFALKLRIVVWNGQYWEVHMVDRQPGSGKFNSIAIDSKGRAHIAYANVKAEFSGLRYASLDGETWKSEVLEGAEGPHPIWSVNLILDKNDNPHIAYTDVQRRLAKYATWRNGRWQLEVVDRISREAYPDRNGIALDSEGNPYVSYYDGGEGTLKVASRKGGKWYVETLARDYAGFTSSLQIHDGMLWVAFADDGGGTLKVARRRLEEPGALSMTPANKTAAK